MMRKMVRVCGLCRFAYAHLECVRIACMRALVLVDVGMCGVGFALPCVCA
jgi:hypothetical protein